MAHLTIINEYGLSIKVDGAVMVGHEGYRERLAEYFEELFNALSQAETLVGWAPRSAVVPDLPKRKDLPSC